MRILGHTISSFAVISTAFFIISGAAQAQAPMAMSPPEVTVMAVETTSVERLEQLPGRTAAHRLAQVRPQVNGILLSRLFEEGQFVEQGQALYQIDDSLYRIALDQAQAQLLSVKANVALAQLRAKRMAQLVASRAVSEQESDEASAALAQAEAAVSLAQAGVRSARINLDYTRVLAPISGQISQSLVTEGALVTAGQANPLAIITQLDPIFVDVMQNSQEHLQMRRELSAEGALPARLQLPDGSEYAHLGELQFSSVFVSESTGAVQLRILFPNPNHELLPGLFVHASLQMGSNQMILIPQQAAQRDNQGALSVWRLTPDNKVMPVPITVSGEVNKHWQLQSGLQAGDRIVIEGFQKLAPGVQVNPVTAAENQLSMQR